MNIEQAKAIAIAEILEKLELKPHKENGTDATCYSPFRNENTPSFHVNIKDNVWFDHGEGIEALNELSSKHPVYGFRKLYAYLRRAGKAWNHKKVYRVYKSLKMNKKRRGKRRLPLRQRIPLEQQESINQKWSMDFMSDSLASGGKFRTFNVMDDCSREVLTIEVGSSISSRRVTRALEQIIDWRGKPLSVRVDNGPEFTSHHFELWCKDQGISIQYTQPGKPTQNGYIERFNRSYL